MPLTQFKVTPEEQAQQGVVAEVGNKLNGTVAQNKAVFDRLCNYLISKYNQVLDLIYTKAETDAQINNKITQIGSGDMAQAIYDPTGQKKDIFFEIAKKALGDTSGNAINSNKLNNKLESELSVKNADTVDGKHANDFYLNYIGVLSAENLLTWASAQAVGGTFIVNSAVTTQGVPELAWYIGSLQCGIAKKMTITMLSVTPKTFINVTSSDIWQGWNNGADGGNASAVNGVKISKGAIAPQSPAADDVWIDTTAKQIKIYSGTAWVQM